MKYASLCLTSYERPDFLEVTLDSLRKQTTYPYELIIHDDGSSNKKNYELLENARTKYGATTITNKSGHNQGQGTALNRMFNMASGDPIIKLDSDLIFDDHWLENAIDIFRRDETVGLLGLLHYYHEPVDSRKTVINPRYAMDYISHTYHTHILGSAFAVRRETWEELGPFSEHSEAFAEDWEFQVKVTESKKWHCALPKESLVKNIGMGYETSTVNKTVSGELPPIKKQPHLLGQNLIVQ